METLLIAYVVRLEGAPPGDVLLYSEGVTEDNDDVICKREAVTIGATSTKSQQLAEAAFNANKFKALVDLVPDHYMEWWKVFNKKSSEGALG